MTDEPITGSRSWQLAQRAYELEHPQLDADKLDRLAALLDGFDDQAAAEARRKAKDIRLGIDGWIDWPATEDE